MDLRGPGIQDKLPESLVRAPHVLKAEGQRARNRVVFAAKQQGVVIRAATWQHHTRAHIPQTQTVRLREE